MGRFPQESANHQNISIRRQLGAFVRKRETWKPYAFGGSCLRSKLQEPESKTPKSSIQPFA
jgi:hypothetical protein